MIDENWFKMSCINAKQYVFSLLIYVRDGEYFLVDLWVIEASESRARIVAWTQIDQSICDPNLRKVFAKPLLVFRKRFKALFSVFLKPTNNVWTDL